MKRVERIMYSEVGFNQYKRLLELEKKADMEAKILRTSLGAKEIMKMRLKTSTLDAGDIRERLAAIHKRIADREKECEKRKYLKIYPDESLNWMIVAFDPQCLWEGNVSEMEEGSRLVVEVVEMTREEVEALPEFEGW